MTLQRAARASFAIGALPRVAVASLALIALVSVLLFPTLVSLHQRWTDTASITYLHGYLVAAIALCLLVREVASNSHPYQPERLLLIPLALFSVLWLVAQRAGIEIAHQALWPVMMLTAMAAALGWRAARNCWFALAFLFFAIPIWDFGDVPLQKLSVAGVKSMLMLTSIPVYVDGSVVHIPEGTFDIEISCNGMHFFIVALALAALFGEIHRDSLRVRVRQFLLAAVLAVVCNWIRIYVVILAGHLTDMQHYLIRVSHYYFGWAVFAVCMAIFFWLVSRTPLAAQRPVQTGAAQAEPSGQRLAAGVFAALAVVCVGPLLGTLARASALPPRADLLPTLENWRGPSQSTAGWHPSYPGSDRSQRGEYRRAGVVATVFVAEYDEQRQGKELVGYGNSVLEGLDGHPVSEQLVPASPGEAVQFEVARSSGHSSVVTYFYEIGGTRRVNPLAAQLSYAAASLVRPVRSRVIAVHVDCAADCATATAAARGWLEDFEAAKRDRSE